MPEHNFVVGSTIVLKDNIHPSLLSAVFKDFEIERPYRVQGVQIVPKEKLLPLDYVEAGYIPDYYKRYMVKGIHTTNHDLMGSDRFVHVIGRKFSALWFRFATVTEVQRHAKSLL